MKHAHISRKRSVCDSFRKSACHEQRVICCHYPWNTKNLPRTFAKLQQYFAWQLVDNASVRGGMFWCHLRETNMPTYRANMPRMLQKRILTARKKTRPPQMSTHVHSEKVAIETTTHLLYASGFFFLRKMLGARYGPVGTWFLWF